MVLHGTTIEEIPSGTGETKRVILNIKFDKDTNKNSGYILQKRSRMN